MSFEKLHIFANHQIFKEEEEEEYERKQKKKKKIKEKKIKKKERKKISSFFTTESRNFLFASKKILNMPLTSISVFRVWARFAFSFLFLVQVFKTENWSISAKKWIW